MERLTDGLKKILLAGIGTVAVTAEKSKDVLDDLVKKGELTVEQGKVLNEELKHNIKKTVKDNVNVSVKASSPEELTELLGKMTPEQLEQLKEQLTKMETAEAVDEESEEAMKETVETASEKKDEELSALIPAPVKTTRFFITIPPSFLIATQM